jgi:hypothetical protein
MSQHAQFRTSTAEQGHSEELSEAEIGLLFVDGNRDQPTEGYTAYLQLNKRIADATALIKTESDPHKRAELNLERSEASLRLSALPKADDFRVAAAKLNKLGRPIRTLDKSAMLKMATAYKGPQFMPRIEKWNDSSGWVRIETTLDDTSSAPIFAVGPSDFAHGPWTPQTFPATKVTKLSLEVKRVLVTRNGIDQSVFYSNNWSTDDGTLISDGKSLVNGERMTGRMPLLITALLLCRNVAISTNLTREAQSSALSASRTASLRFGTISIGGSYLIPASDLRYYPAIGSRGLLNPELQVIALLCEQIGPSPSKASTSSR